jgi:S-adenosylmethionine hydrolase
MSVITLTTDFGLQDAYVAALKGVILSTNPSATIVDICHSIEPQNIRQAAFVLSTVYGYFPRGTIHTVIVDPGVGSERRAMVLRTEEAFFVAPDNGVLSYVLLDASAGKTPSNAGLMELPPGLQAVEITNPEFWHHPVSATFHGRDVFAPVAAHLSLGTPVHRFGDPVTSLNVLPVPRPHIHGEGTLTGCVLHIDAFGNVVTNIREEHLPSGVPCIQVAGHRIVSVSSTYASAEPGQPIALMGSSGYLEIAVRNASAASVLGVQIGDGVSVYTEPRPPGD